MIPNHVNRPLKTVTDRIRSCRAVLWALETFGDRLLDILDGEFSPLVDEGQAMPFSVQQLLFRKKLILGRDRMVDSDRSYRDQRARESIFRGRRDGEVKKVNSEVVGLRNALSGIFSEEKLAEFGFARHTPQVPEELLEQVSHLATRLDDPSLDISGARFGEFRFEAPDLAKRLATAVDTLRQATENLAREERKSEAKKLAKDEALSEYNRWFLWIARTVESLCHLAGLDEVAKRVRPSDRRKGVTAEKFKEPKAGESEGSQEPKAADSAASESS